MKKRVTRWLGLLLSFVMLLMTLQISVTAAGETNLCAGIVPTLSQEASRNDTAKATQAAALTDGKIANGYSNSAWFIRNDVNADIVPTATFDLGEEKKVGKWVITGASSFKTAFAKKYDISYSADGENWTVAKSVENNTEYAATTEFSNIAARYWRLTVYFTGENNTDLDKASPYEQVRISEIEMYEGEDAQDFGVEITAPGTLSELSEGDNLTLKAAVTGAADSVTKVEFSVGNNTVAAVQDAQDNSVWTAAAENLSAGDYSITAAAYVGESSVCSEPINVRVHATTYTNIAQGKPAKVSVISTGAASGIVDGDSAASTGTHVWFVNGTMVNSTPSNGATAEIDLADGYPNTFLLQSIKLYTGGNGDPAVSDFALYYKLGETWTEAASETGNTEGAYTYTFPEEVEADAVRFVCNTANLKLRVREIEVYGKVLRPEPPSVTVPSTNMTVSTNEVEITATVDAGRDTISKIGAELNGAATDAQVTGSGMHYKVKVSGLVQGENTVVITAESSEGLVGRSEIITVTYDPSTAEVSAIEIITPKESTEMCENEALTITAQVTGKTQGITAVRFYAGETLLASGRERTDNRWTAKVEALSIGTYTVTAKAYRGEVEAAVSEAITVTVSEFKSDNISKKKPVGVSYLSTGSASGITDGNTTATSGNYVWFVNGTISATPSGGAWAEIDLEEMYSVNYVRLFSGRSDSGPVPDFTFYYRVNGEWIEALKVTGNTQEDRKCNFDEIVKTDGIRFVCNTDGIKFCVREIRVAGALAKAEAPVITAPDLKDGTMNVFEETVTLTANVNANGSTIREIGAEVNGKPVEVETEGSGSEYKVTVKGLVSGNNTVFLLAENADGTLGYSDELTLVYYSSEDFMTAFAAVNTQQQLGQFIMDNKSLLELEEDDYTNQEKYGRIYSGVLKAKNEIKTIADFLAVFTENKKLEEIRTAGNENFIEVLQTAFSEIDVSMLETASSNIKTSFAAMVKAAEFHNAAELAKCVETSYALSKIKYTPWNGLTSVLEQYHTCLELTDYQDYAALTPAQKSYANQMIAADRASGQMNTKEGFKAIFTEAVAKGKNYTGGSGTGSGGGSGSGSGGRGSGSKVSGGTISVPPNMTAPNEIDVNYYSDVTPSHEAWNAITYMTKIGKIQGVGNGQFLPDASITREEFVKILVEALFTVDASATTAFQDVAVDSWYYKYVATAQKLGVVNGISETSFGSGAHMTREEMATLVYRAAAATGISLDTEGSSAVAADEDNISTWAYYPIYALRRSGMITGENVRPRDRATRAEAVQLLYQMILMEG
ncbi:MAG: hypothetical protein HFI90_05825 [Clostridia bacterium]|nr:hypothetical protein [Clostridia bacterium]